MRGSLLLISVTVTVVRILIHSLIQECSACSVVGSVPGAGDNTVNKTKVLV